jgi:hypothetical protein
MGGRLALLALLGTSQWTSAAAGAGLPGSWPPEAPSIADLARAAPLAPLNPVIAAARSP